MSALVERRVRVTIEGTARELGSHVLRVQHAADATILVDTRLDGVTVEDVVPPRTWTDGDVVQAEDAGRIWWTAVRRQGDWYTSSGGVLSDAALAAIGEEMRLTPVRYQAGEVQ